MSRKKRARKKAGSAPGTLMHVGRQKMEKQRIRIFDYTAAEMEEHEFENIEDCFKYRDRDSVSWINIDGLHEVEALGKLGKHFDVHPLILEDVLSPHQRPKIEFYGDQIYIVMRMLSRDTNIESEQLSLLLGNNYVITFQERVGDVFAGVRERIRKGGPRIRTRGSDYLTYALIDAVIDSYFVLLEQLDEEMEALEPEVMQSPDDQTLRKLHGLKKDLITFRKSTLPVREMLNTILRDESRFIDPKNEEFFRDAYDHILRVNETLESYREFLSSLLESYRSTIGQRMNEIMQVLTIIATIFIPLTFIAGIYGMNFKVMPELEFEWGYPVALGAMGVLGALMLYYFRRKNWL